VKAEEAFDLGAKFLENQDLDKALVAFSQAIRIDPQYAQAYNGRAVTYALLGQPERALADCSEAIRLEPKEPEFYRSRGYIYSSVGDDANADADLAKADELEAAGSS
jgi:Tfp pilus assembly protein PilF